MEPEDVVDLSPRSHPLGWEGSVLSVQANYYWVRLDHALTHEPAPGVGSPAQDGGRAVLPTMLLCTRRAKLKKLGQRVSVGDRVLVEEPDWAGSRGAITAVLPRRSFLARPPIANVDQVILVFALKQPDLDSRQLTRFLVQIEHSGLNLRLVLSKSDLASPTERQAWCDRLADWGYACHCLSAHTGEGVATLLAALQGCTSALAGPSGVGKSSLINRLIPSADLRVGAVSGKLARGRHTTRHVELLQLPQGGLLADTPGFNQPDMTCLPDELAACFPEIRQRLQAGTCQFADCLHDGEPACVIRGDWERYEHYRALLAEAIAYQAQLSQQTTPDAQLKRRTGQAGEAHYEPRLAPKKYRRPSRRTQQQALETLYQDLE
ncbi:small ribosomal subunit biogenesis GTPase RsgA [Trichothermofontia sp.]